MDSSWVGTTWIVVLAILLIKQLSGLGHRVLRCRAYVEFSTLKENLGPVNTQTELDFPRFRRFEQSCMKERGPTLNKYGYRARIMG